MMLLALIAVPALGAIGAYAHRAIAFRTVWLVGVAAVHVGLVAAVWAGQPAPALGGWIAVDDLGLIVLTVLSLLFFVAATYAVGYLRRENPRGGRAFVSCLLAFLSAASLVSLSQHLGVLWVGMEASTLAMAPLIYHRHDRRSLEAVWKYLMLSSVGIALALLGTFFMATAQFAAPASDRPLVLPDLVRGAGALDPAWLRAAFVFLLAGYGTKMGLAPLHTWKPDTYGEAPSLVGALMAGGLTGLAFLGVARVTQVVTAAGLGTFAQPVLIAFGVASLVVAAAFVIGQTDLKRLLAYSSVEHMGLLVLGLGLGGAGAYGSSLHLVNNALAKGLLFLTVGNVVLVTGTSATGAMQGLGRVLPLSASLLVLGLFAATGSPPFGPFVSEFIILRAALTGGHVMLTLVVVALLMVIFAGMALSILRVVLGEPDHALRPERETVWLVAGPAVLAVTLLGLGLYLPTTLGMVLRQAAAALGGHAP
jgi:hydrogenase-4 component F